jgi:divalent metal cation (Fe/Co/Zn/Cd) transporter
MRVISLSFFSNILSVLMKGGIGFLGGSQARWLTPW